MPKNISTSPIVLRVKAKFLNLVYKFLHNLIPATLASTLLFFVGKLKSSLSNVLTLIFEPLLTLFAQPITLSSWPSPRLCPQLLLILHFSSTFSKKPFPVGKVRVSCSSLAFPGYVYSPFDHIYYTVLSLDLFSSRALILQPHEDIDPILFQA